jgi:hypothetical protein
MSASRGYALSGPDLFAFDLTNPTVVQSFAVISGVTAGETLVGIDFRPLNGLLYGLGVNDAADTATLYVISPQTGVAGAVGSFALAGLPAGNYGFDFNPAVDRIRVTTDTGLNFRINPNTGLVVGTDTMIGGANAISGAAYTNNQPDNGGITTLYTLDSATDQLMIQNPPNGGVQNPVGSTGVDFTNANGFDIPAGVNAAVLNGPVALGSGYALLTVGGTVRFYTINLASGAATLVGDFLNGFLPANGLAVQNDLGGIPAFALSADGANLIRFNTATPGTTTTLAVAGVFAGETLVGIDDRGSTGQLFALGVNAAADTATLYRVEPQTGGMTAIGAPGGIAFVAAGGSAVDLPSGGYGIDFNPAVDRIRVTTDSGLNFLVNPNNGAAVDGDVDTPGVNTGGAINGLPAGASGVSAAAYTNSDDLPGGAATLYTLDAASDALYIQNPANSGTQVLQHTVTLGGSTLDFTSANGFDIPGSVSVTTSGSPAAGFGFADLTVGGVTSLYAINLQNGAAIDLGAIGTGAVPLSGLALGAVPSVRTGTPGDDTFVAFGGTEHIDAGGGIDTIAFGFKLVDATVAYAGNKVFITTATEHAVVSGFEKYVFTDGTVDNNDGNPLVDDLFYYARYHDVWNAHADADAHYNTFGWHENRDPNAFFSTNIYLSANPDVRAAGVNPLDQWHTTGWIEGRVPSTLFDPAHYLAANPDVAAAHIDPLAHFLQFGAAEGRQAFAPSALLAANGFDYVYYLSHNLDVLAAHVDPLQHFLTFGWKEGRNPNALFDVNGYLATYTDVAAAHVNPLTHYDISGWREGRDPSVNFDTTSYLAAYPDVAAANINPLTHFLQFGIHEGRSPFADGVWG